MADQIRRIHSFATKRGLKPLTDYLDNREMSEDGSDDESGDNGRSDWHSPTEGLQAVRQLVEAIQSDPKAGKHWNKEDPDGLETLLGDLEDLARCLEEAASVHSQFRLEIG